MCQKNVVTHSVCGHVTNDLFPCGKSIEDGTCPISDLNPTTEDTSCPTYADDAHFAAALKQIETDASLAAVPRTVKDPSAPKRWAKTREHYAYCNHFANVIQQDFELDDDSPEYITEELPSSCHRCCAALDWQIEQKKERGEWNDDPWGEMQKCTTIQAVRSADGDVGPSRRPETAAAGGSAPARQDLAAAVTYPAPAAALPGVRFIDFGGKDGNGDTTPGKNKGVADRAPRTRVHEPGPESEPEPFPEYEHGFDNEDALQASHILEPAPTDLLNFTDLDSTHAPTPAYAPAQPPFRAYGPGDDSSSDDEFPAPPRGPRASARGPSSARSYSRSPPLSPSGHLDLADMAIGSDDEDFEAERPAHDGPAASHEDSNPSAQQVSAGSGTEEFIHISPEERARYAIPALLNLTAVGFEGFKRRQAQNTGKHMAAYRAGELSEKDK